MAMQYIPIPSVVSFIQIIASTVALLLMKMMGVKIDDLEWTKMKAYSWYIVSFVGAVYSNMQALNHTNVETVIVFRACTPIAVSVIEYFFMGRQWPNARSTTSLVLVALGAVAYCLTDSTFAISGITAYTWVIIYFFMIAFEMTYGKQLTSSVKMESVWGPVLYCNLLAAIPMFLLGYLNGDYNGVDQIISKIPFYGAMVLLFTCVTGTLIGYVVSFYITIILLFITFIIMLLLYANTVIQVGCVVQWSVPLPILWLV